jgi:hypothetical protein
MQQAHERTGYKTQWTACLAMTSFQNIIHQSTKIIIIHPHPLTINIIILIHRRHHHHPLTIIIIIIHHLAYP